MSSDDRILPHRTFTPFYPERTGRLHAMLISCGHQKIEQGQEYSWNGLRRGNSEFVIWQYTLAGQGNLRFGETEQSILPGHAMLVIVPENHCYSLPPNSPFWEFLFVTVNGSELVRLARELRRRSGLIIPHSADSAPVALARQMLFDHEDGKINNRYRASSLAYEFMMSLLAEPTPGEKNRDDEFLKTIHHYCLEHIADPLDVNELAEIAGCSRWHFTRRFQEAEGKSPHQFVIELKMRLAIRLLQTTPYTVKEIAAECGFEDPSYFCKVFKNFYQSTPAGFREAATHSL